MTISTSFNCSLVGFLFLPYKLIIGKPVFSSFPLEICSPFAASPRNPCSGANILRTSIPTFNKVSTKCVLFSMAV